MFDIHFTTGVPEAQENGWVGLWGQTTFGAEQELFIASLSVWSQADYERHWRAAAERLVNGAPSSAFFTSAFQFWWAMWRDGTEIRVHEELLSPERLRQLGPSPDLSRAPYELIGEYARTTHEGEAISEWRLDISDVQAYLAGLGSF